jgi:hypothetical protein
MRITALLLLLKKSKAIPFKFGENPIEFNAEKCIMTIISRPDDVILKKVQDK